MKNIIRLSLLAAVAAVSIGCANMTFRPVGSNARLVSTVATVAFLTKQSPSQQAASIQRIQAASAKLQEISLSEDLTSEAVAFALAEISRDPAWAALSSSLVRAYRPEVGILAEPQFRAALVDISQGMIDAIEPYVTQSTK
jgi:hypothetical protein